MEQPASRHDVIVVGARAAGAATAMLLARSGLDVLVLDRSRYGADTLSTHALMRGGVVQLHRWGLLDAVVAAGTPRCGPPFTYADQEVTVTIKPSHGVDALYAPRRTVLDPILVDAAVAAGAQVRFGSTVSDVTRDSDGRIDGDRSGPGPPAVRPRPPWSSAPTGRSPRSPAVGAPTERAGTGATAVVYGYWPGLDVDGYHWVFRRDASAGVIPTNDGLWCVFAAATPENMGTGGLEGLQRAVRRGSPDLADRLAAAPSLGRPRVQSVARAPAGPLGAGLGPGRRRRLLEGSHRAHGLTDALRDAELLAWPVSAAAAGAGEAALSEYETRQVSLPFFEVVDTIAGMRWTDAEIRNCCCDSARP